MTREKQIEYAAEIISYGCSDELTEALIKDFPEIIEGENTKVIRAIIDILQNSKGTREYLKIKWNLEYNEVINTLLKFLYL